MAKYRKIDPRIWNDEDFRPLSDSAKLLFLFLLTHPHLTSLGAMRATPAGLATELGWSEKVFRLSLEQLLRKPFVKVCETSSYFALINFIKYNQPENPNVLKSWESALDYIPECDYKWELIEEVKAFAEGLGEAFGKALPKAFQKSKAFGKAFRKPLANHEQEPQGKTIPYPRQLFEIYQTENKNLPAVRELTLERSKKCNARGNGNKEKFRDDFREAIIRAQTCPFLQGKNTRGWKADFGWLIENDTNIYKILEGKYDSSDSQPTENKIDRLRRIRDEEEAAEEQRSRDISGGTDSGLLPLSRESGNEDDLS